MKTYLINEAAVQAFQDIIECAQSEILEPTSPNVKMVVLRMLEKGIEMIEVIRTKMESDAALNNFAGAEEIKVFVPKGDLHTEETDMMSMFGHERGQFDV